MHSTPTPWHRGRSLARSLLPLGIAALLLQNALAVSTLPFYDSFDSYADENLGGTTSVAVWDFGNSSSSSSPKVRAVAAQSYPGLTNNGNTTIKGVIGGPSGGTSSKNRGASFTPQTSGMIYASVLVSLTALPTANREVFGLTSNSSGTSATSGASVVVDPAGRLLVLKRSGTAVGSTYPLATNTTHLVVLSYTFNPGTNDDVVALWIDPTPLGDNAQVPPANLSTSNGNDQASLQGVAILAPTPVYTGINYDEVRVGTSWADVTPLPSGTPAVLYSVTGGGLVCDGGGSGVSVGLSGSQSGVDYWLATNGVFTGTVLNGTGSSLDFGSQTATATYSVLASNTTTFCTTWMSGKANVTVSSAPSISTPPASMSAAAGASGTFSVVAAGDDLTYQWRRDGTNLVEGGSYFGVNTPNLTISPITAAEAAPAANGYDVVVSGHCPPAVFSAKVGLTLKSPSSLVWTGDGLANAWDTAALNWLDGATPAAFAPGDAVVFDDPANNPLVTVAGVALNPASVTVQGTGNYSFVGSGSIVGAATSLTKAGTGTLTISNVNGYAGGTVLSNGVLALGSNPANYDTASSRSGLGATNSPVTFRGGTLQLYGFAGSTSPNYSTFRNPLVVPVGEVGTLQMFPRGPVNSGNGSGLQSSLTGGGTLNLVANYVRDNLDGDWSAFTGLINVTCKPGDTSDEMRINNNYGYSNAAIFLNDGVILDRVGTANATNDIGELGGTALANIAAGNSSAQNPTWRVGWKNTTNTFAGTIADDGQTSVTKVGTGTWVLSGANTYTGNTTVEGGLLQVDGSLYSPVYVTGGTLGGTGTFYGPVTIQAGGTLSPGGSTGTLTTYNTLQLDPGSTTVMELNKAAGTNDQVTVYYYSISCGGTLVVTNLGGTLAAGDSFTLFVASVYLGAFDTLVLPPLAPGLWWDTSSLLVDGSLTIRQAMNIASVTSNQGQVVVSGAGGATNRVYYVLSATNLVAPVWLPVATNQFNPDGTFSFTNAVSPALPQQFYRVQMP